MKIIVGLGNPGPEYAKTRHNIGWMVIDAFAAKFRIRIDKHEKDAMTGAGRVAGGSVLVAKPQTYMNQSGDAVRLLVNAYSESLDDLIIVYDDIDLPLGKLRIKPNGGPGTHNGMRSIVSALATEKFARLRIGIGGVDSNGRLRDYVLGEIAPDEESAITRAIERSVDALLLFVRGDLKRAMNEFNRDVDEPADDPAKT
ncbi:MAG TPA: aminoacyl-tRNA hydrolase [Thermoanaerobaculia bacterium]